MSFEHYGFNEDKSKYEFSNVAATILDQIYPVGAVYFTMDDDFDPNSSEIFPGSWQKVSGYLVGTGSEQGITEIESEAGHIGGSRYRTLTPEQCPVPAHTHPVNITSGSHSHVENDYVYVPRHPSQAVSTINSWSVNKNATHKENSVIYNMNHKVNGAQSKVSTASTTVKITGNTGNNATTTAESFEILPPYTSVNAWKRTA